MMETLFAILPAPAVMVGLQRRSEGWAQAEGNGGDYDLPKPHAP